MRERLFAVLVASVFLGVAPAMADHMGFSFTDLRTTFSGTTFTTTASAATSGKVYRIELPPGQAKFFSAQDAADLFTDFGVTVPTWGSGSEAVLFSMTISEITAATAKGLGTFTLTDVEGDTLSGAIGGTWVKQNGHATFHGGLSDVIFTSHVDSTFDGHTGRMSMVFGEAQPWGGAVVQVNGGSGWFTQNFSGRGGSIDAVLPAPAAALLGVLGLSAAGWKLRRFV